MDIQMPNMNGYDAARTIRLLEGKISEIPIIAMTVLSMNFGFVFLRASFGDKITSLENEQYIVESIRSLVSGISV